MRDWRVENHAARNVRFVLAAAAAAGISGWAGGGRFARAADFVWDKGAGTFLWSDAANWNPDGVPGSAAAPSTGADDNVTFNNTTAANVGSVDLGNVNRAVASVTFAADTPSAYNLTNGTLTTGVINRSSPDTNNLIRVVGTSTVSLNAPAAGEIVVNNTNTTSFFNIQGVITATTFTHSATSTGRTVLGLAAGLTNVDNNAVTNWVINGGVLETRSVGTGTTATNYISLGTGAVSLGAATLDLRTDATITYGNNVTLTGNGTLSVNRSGTTATGQTITLGTIAMGGQTLNVTGGNTYALAAGVTTLAGNPTFNPTTANLTLASINAGAASPARTITKTGTGILAVTGAGTNFTGTTTASVIGGLTLGSPTALGTAVTYNLTNAAGINHPELRVTGAGNAADVYNVPATGIIAGDNAFLGSLTIGADLQIASGATDDAIIAQTAAGGNNSVGNLPTTPTYLFGLAANHSPGTVTVGTGTPWKGISGDRTGPGAQTTIRSFQTGTIVTNGDFILQGLSTANAGGEFRLAIGNGTGAGGVTITPSTPTSAIVRNGRVQLDDNTPVFNANLTFDIQNGAVVQLLHNASLGQDAAAANNAKIIARSGAQVDPNGAVLISGNVSLRQGSLLQLNDATNLGGGAGAYTQEAGAITQIQNATALGGAGNPGTVPGSVLRVEVDNATIPDAKKDPASNLVTFGGNRQMQSFTLNSAAGIEVALPNGGTTPTGVFTNDATSRSPTNTGVTNVTTVTIGAGGGVIAASTGTTLTLAPIASNTSGGWLINGPGNTLQIGAAGMVDGLAKAGTVVVTGGNTTTANPSTYGITVGQVDIVAGRLENLSGGMPYNIGTPVGTGFTNVSAGAEFRSNTGTPSNARLNVLGVAGATPAGIARFIGTGGATVGSIEGAGSIIIGNADATSRTLSVGVNNLDTEFSGVISQNNTGTTASNLAKAGTGTLILSGAAGNTYRGTTTVSAGTLLVNTAHATAAAPAGNYSITAAATLGGTGTINVAANGTVTASSATVGTPATIAPGASIGTLTVAMAATNTTGGVVLGNNSLLAIETGPGNTSDRLVVGGTAGVLDLRSTADALDLTGFSGGTFTIATFTGGYGGGSQPGNVFDTVLVNGQPAQSGNPAADNFAAVTYGANQITVTVANPVPEPAAAGLLGVAAAGLLVRRRRPRG